MQQSPNCSVPKPPAPGSNCDSPAVCANVKEIAPWRPKDESPEERDDLLKMDVVCNMNGVWLITFCSWCFDHGAPPEDKGSTGDEQRDKQPGRLAWISVILVGTVFIQLGLGVALMAYWFEQDRFSFGSPWDVFQTPISDISGNPYFIMAQWLVSIVCLAYTFADIHALVPPLAAYCVPVDKKLKHAHLDIFWGKNPPNWQLRVPYFCGLPAYMVAAFVVMAQVVVDVLIFIVSLTLIAHSESTLEVVLNGVAATYILEVDEKMYQAWFPAHSLEDDESGRKQSLDNINEQLRNKLHEQQKKDHERQTSRHQQRSCVVRSLVMSLKVCYFCLWIAMAYLVPLAAFSYFSYLIIAHQIL